MTLPLAPSAKYGKLAKLMASEELAARAKAPVASRAMRPLLSQPIAVV